MENILLNQQACNKLRFVHTTVLHNIKGTYVHNMCQSPPIN